MKIDDANKISDNVVALLKAERIRQGMSQYKLDKECGLSKTSVAYLYIILDMLLHILINHQSYYKSFFTFHNNNK